MLVLVRKEGQELLIGDNIIITVVRIEGNHVRIGIEAPREVPIVRLEAKDKGPRWSHVDKRPPADVD